MFYVWFGLSQIASERILTSIYSLIITYGEAIGFEVTQINETYHDAVHSVKLSAIYVIIKK